MTTAAWRTKPSFVVVTTNATIASPLMQPDQVKRIGATESVEVSGKLRLSLRIEGKPESPRL